METSLPSDSDRAAPWSSVLVCRAVLALAAGLAITSLTASARAQSYSPYSPDAHTILLYHFDEAAGGGVTANAVAGGESAYTWTFTGSTGSANNTLLGAAAYPGFGNCVDLGTATDAGVAYDGNGNSTYDGETTDAIAMSTLGIGGANPFTLEAIISPNAVPTVNREIVATDSSAATRGFQFRMTSGNQLEFHMIASGAQVFANIPTAGPHAIVAGSWYHVAFVYDGATCRFFWTKLDGLTSTANQAGSTQALNLTGAGTITGPLIIGNENRGAGGEGAQARIDEVRISSVARTPGEMAPASVGGLPYAPRGFSAITSSGTVNLSWSASGVATGYKVYRSTVSGSYGPTPLASTGTTGYVDTGVTDGTTYYYVVTAENGAGESAASTEVSATPGNATTLLSDNFEAGLGDWSNIAGDTADWTRDSGGTPSSGTGPAGGANGSTWYVYLETSVGGANTAGDTAYLESAFIEGSSRTLTFFYHMYGTDMGTLNVDVFHDGSWSNGVWSLSGQQQTSNGEAYTQATVNLGAYSGAIRLRFRGVAAGGYRGDMAIDDVVVTGVPSPPGTDPKVYLKFDETSGTTAADSSGNGLSGTLVNGGTWVSGKVDNAVSLSGNAHVVIPSGVVSAMTDFTVAAWVKLNSISNWARLFDFGSGTSSYMFLTPQNGGTGSVRFAILTSGGVGEQVIDGAAPLATGTWTHVAVTLSGSTGTLFVNGTPVGMNVAMTYNPAALSITTQNYIGRSQFGADPYLDGLVDDFRIYNRALDPSEIADLLTITSKDEDNDGLPDSWEQLIIDADPNDGIATIQDVQPGEDFDDDDLTNLQEYQNGTDATGADNDIDDDQLSDAWEIIKLGTLGHGAYDDNDSDGSTNLAEQEGGTNPMDAASHPSWKAPRVAFLRDSVVAGNALLMPGGSTYGRAINGISYNQEILLTFNGYQYTAWYDTVGTVQTVWLARRTIDDTGVGVWEKVNTGSTFENGDENAWDAHNVIVLGICPADGTLHMSWDHHNNTLRYRRSIVDLCTTASGSWGAGMLGAEQDWLISSGQTEYDVTYPEFTTTPSGGLVLNRRIGSSGNGRQLMYHYNPFSHAWGSAIQFTSSTGNYNGSTSRNAYINGLDFSADGTIHVSWTWREGSGTSNHDICYAYSEDNGVTWKNNAGTVIANTASGGSIGLNSPGIVIKALDLNQLLINQQAQCVDDEGRVHVLMLHRREDPGYQYPNITTAAYATIGTAYYHYFRDPVDGTWHQRRIPLNPLPDPTPPTAVNDGTDEYPVGSRPKIAYDAAGNLYAAYTSYSTAASVFPGYSNGVLIVASTSKESAYTDWEVVQVINTQFDGEPLIDQDRLLADNVLSVYIQENSASSTYVGTPLHAFDFAVDIREPNPTSLKFFGKDVVTSIESETGFFYQLQMSTDLSQNGWLEVGDAVPGQNGILGLRDPGGALDPKRFYRIEIVP